MLIRVPQPTGRFLPTELCRLDFSLPTPGEEVMVHRLIDALHHAPALRELSVRNCTNVNDRIMRPLHTRALERLDVRGTNVTHGSLEMLVASCPSLAAIAADPEPCGSSGEAGGVVVSEHSGGARHSGISAALRALLV